MFNNLISIILKSKTLLVLLRYVYCSTSFRHPFANHVKFEGSSKVEERKDLLKKIIRNLNCGKIENPLKFGVPYLNEKIDPNEKMTPFIKIHFIDKNEKNQTKESMNLFNFMFYESYIFVINNSQKDPVAREFLAIFNSNLNLCLSNLNPLFNTKTWINFNQILSIMPNNKIEFISAEVDDCKEEDMLDDEGALTNREKNLTGMLYFPLKDEKIILFKRNQLISSEDEETEEEIEEYGILVYKMVLKADGSFLLMYPQLLVYDNIEINKFSDEIESSRFVSISPAKMFNLCKYNFEKDIQYITEDYLTNLISKDTLKKYQNLKIVKDKHGKSKRDRLNLFGIGKEGTTTSLIGKYFVEKGKLYINDTQFTIYTDFELQEKLSSPGSDQPDSFTIKQKPITSKNSDIGNNGEFDSSKKTYDSKKFNTSKESDSSKSSGYGNIIIISIVLILFVVLIISICYFLKNRKEINEIKSARFFS